MKSRKVVISLILLIGVFSLFSRTINAEIIKAEQFSDLPSGWSREAVINNVSNGILCGIEGKIKPKDNLTRAQLAAIVNRAFGIDKKADISAFSDVSTNDWFYDDMAKAYNSKTVVGTGNKLLPYNEATREEVYTVLARALDLKPAANASSLYTFADKNDVSGWAANHLAAMIEKGYMKGSDGKLKPKSKITREEFSFVIDQLQGSNINSTKVALGAVAASSNNSLAIIASAAPRTSARNSASSDRITVSSATPVAATVRANTPTPTKSKYSNQTVTPSYSNVASTQPSVVVPEIPKSVAPILSDASQPDVVLPASDSGNYTLSNLESTLKDMVITGDLLIPEGTVNGQLTLDNVAVSGEVIVTDTGLNSILVTGGTTLRNIHLSNSDDVLNLMISNGSVNSVAVDSGRNEVIIEGNIGTVDVNCQTPVTINQGNISVLNVNSANSYITLTESSVVSFTIKDNAVYSQANLTNNSVAQKIQLDSSGTAIMLSENSVVDNMSVSESAIGSAVTVMDKSAINQVEMVANDTMICAKDNATITKISILPSANNTVIDTDSSSTVLDIDDQGVNTIKMVLGSS